MGKSFLFCSGKGGVGKTSTAINLAFSLCGLGKRVALVDANISNPNIGFHLKIPEHVQTLNELMDNSIKPGKVPGFYNWNLRIVPASYSMGAINNFNEKDLRETLKRIKLETEIMLIDSAPGIGSEVMTAMGVTDRVVIVTNPEIPALADAVKTIKIAENSGVKVEGVVINRIGRFKHEIKEQEIIKVLDDVPIIGRIPEDSFVANSVSMGLPIVLKYPAAKAAISLREIASKISGTKENYQVSIIDQLQLWLEKMRP